MMRHDVVHNGRRHHVPALQAKGAQRMLPQLRPAQTLPPSGFIEATSRHSEGEGLFLSAARRLPGNSEASALREFFAV
jgi:hypothetical protein